MSAIDHPDAAWYHPSFLGEGDKVGHDAADARAGWVGVANAGATRPGHAAFRIATRLIGGTQLHHVNALDPGTAGSWLLPGAELDSVAWARKAVGS